MSATKPLDCAYAADMLTWVATATNQELRRALDKAVTDMAAAWSDNARSYPAMRERLILVEMKQRLAR
jgi:hypothetical protein